MPAQGFSQALLSKFFARRIEGFGNAVGVEGDCIPAEGAGIPRWSNPIP